MGSAFYIAYLVAVLPQSFLMQRFPVGRVLSINLLLFGAFLMCHAACSSFAPLLILRLGLGVAESSVTAGFLIVTSQFYLIEESAARVSYWFLYNGAAMIVSALTSFGVQHANLGSWKPWRLFVLVLGGATLLLAVCFFIWFPANGPGDAKFLTKRERAICVKRIEKNKTGIENRVFKPEQVMEALKDVKIWLFALFTLLDNMPNSLTNQRAQIINSLGFDTKTTALLSIPNGVVEILTLLGGTYTYRKTGQLAWTGCVFFIPSIIACIIVPSVHNPYVQLTALYFTTVCVTGFVFALSWLNTSTTGHTKKLTANGMNLIAYCVGNLLGNLYWKAEFKPRNIVPWSINTVCYSTCAVLLLVIRVLLKRRNAVKDAKLRERGIDPATIDANRGHDEVVRTEPQDEEKAGASTEKVNVAFLDLTDLQNDEFKYIL